MDTNAIVIMEKNIITGILESEVGIYSIKSDLNLIDSIYMMKKDDKKIVTLKLTTAKDVEDWEFSAILDYYDEEIFNGEIMSCEEVEDTFNPVWELKFELLNFEDDMEEKLDLIVSKHGKELNDVYEEIKDKKNDY